MSTITIEAKHAAGRPEGYPENCEILNHGHLRRSTADREGLRPFYVRFNRPGYFLPQVTPDANIRYLDSPWLVRVIAVSEEEVPDIVNYHYSGINGLTIEKRTPVRIIDAHLYRIVEWPAEAVPSSGPN